jgi:phosphatidylglycerophosphate synthase
MENSNLDEIEGFFRSISEGVRSILDFFADLLGIERREPGALKEHLADRKEQLVDRTGEILDFVNWEVVFSIPNMFSYSRLPFGFLLLYMIKYDFNVLAVGAVFAIAAVTDALDGFLAVRLNQQTYVGAFVDPFFDKIFLACCAFGFYQQIDHRIFWTLFSIEFVLLAVSVWAFFAVMMKVMKAETDIKSNYFGKTKFALECLALSFLIIGGNFFLWGLGIVVLTSLVFFWYFFRRWNWFYLTAGTVTVIAIGFLFQKLGPAKSVDFTLLAAIIFALLSAWTKIRRWLKERTNNQPTITKEVMNESRAE